MNPAAEKSLKLLALPWKFIKTIILLLISRSLRLLNLHLDYDWEPVLRITGAAAGFICLLVFILTDLFLEQERTSARNTPVYISRTFQQSIPRLNFDYTNVALVDGKLVAANDATEASHHAYSAAIITFYCGLLLLSSANTVYCISQTTTKWLFSRSPDDPPETASARRVLVSESPQLPRRNPSDSLWDRIRQWLIAILSKRDAAPPDIHEVWQITIWQPPLFSLFFASAFSPVHLAVVFLWPEDNLALIAAVALITLAGYYITSRFLQLCADQQIVAQDVIDELQMKVVRPEALETGLESGSESEMMGKSRRRTTGGSGLYAESIDPNRRLYIGTDGNGSVTPEKFRRGFRNSVPSWGLRNRKLDRVYRR